MKLPTVRALEKLLDYQPSNPMLSVENLKQLQSLVTQDTQNINQMLAVLDQARDTGADNTHTYHDLVVAARTYVVGQFGADFPAVESIGLTRKSNRKSKSRQKPKV